MMCGVRKRKRKAAGPDYSRLTPVVRLAAYDWIVLNSSAGKDSQTMLAVVVERCQREGIPLSRVVVVHCDLGRVEWAGTVELARLQASFYGVRFEVVKRKEGDILQHVLDRHESLKRKGKFTTSPTPSNGQRWCTSDHKRDQVRPLITRLVAETIAVRGKKHLVRVLNCMGMRAQESEKRSTLKPFYLDKRNTNGKRHTHVWLPIFAMSVDEVWQHIRARHVPHHYAYDLGMGRLSCCFCFYAPPAALLLAGKYNRPLLDDYIAVEERTGFTFKIGLPMVEIRNRLDRGEQPGPVSSWEMP